MRSPALWQCSLWVAFSAGRCADVDLAQVLVDVNWRPVFWEGHEDAPERIKEYVDKADIIKLSEEEAEFIYGVPCNDALFDPIQVGCAVLATKPCLVLLCQQSAGWLAG